MISQIGRKITRSSAKNTASLSAGITLLEVLVAISIMAICIIAIFDAFISCFDAQLRSENHAKTAMISMDALEYAEEFPISLSPEELNEDIRKFTWQFTQNDIEEYPKLKEIVIDTTWEQGKRSGRLSLTTYCWNPQKE
ncbi:MAG: prepilin-type N-terminal cleavage/methylation domain-containing protein [Planctomycetes bacterium]|nr:prepilin-type N-terminal cleavage/methylation domain-containing protein [Planctomycetota bacterium]